MPKTKKSILENKTSSYPGPVDSLMKDKFQIHFIDRDITLLKKGKNQVAIWGNNLNRFIYCPKKVKKPKPRLLKK